MARLATLSREFAPDLGVVIHDSLDAAESEWRRFEDIADCTAFQSFDWLATWHRHIGRPDGVRPVIVVGTYADGETAFILPLAIASKLGIKRLCWFGQEQCDYNAPLLARDFSQRVSPECFLAAWGDAASTNAARPAAAPRLDRAGEDAANGRRPGQSVHVA